MTDDTARHLNILGALALGCADLAQAQLENDEISPSTAACLLAIYARPGSTIKDVAAAAALSHSRAVRVIDGLVKAGLVARQKSTDGREVALTATNAGTNRAQAALKRRRAALAQAAEALGPGELEQLSRLAQKVLSGFHLDQAGAWRICRFCEHQVCREENCPVGSTVLAT